MWNPTDTGPTVFTAQEVELAGMIGSIAHLACHLGAIRQIANRVRGPKEGTF